MSVTSLGDIGSRGLVVYDGDRYRYVTESAWRNAGTVENPPATLPLADLTKVQAVVAKLENTIYVDLDLLADLEDPSGDVPQATEPWTTNGTSIVLKERNQYYQITEHELEELEEGAEGDAGVIVRRGGVVAAIPSNMIPSGTYCVLVNLESFKEQA